MDLCFHGRCEAARGFFWSCRQPQSPAPTRAYLSQIKPRVKRGLNALERAEKLLLKMELSTKSQRFLPRNLLFSPNFTRNYLNKVDFFFFHNSRLFSPMGISGNCGMRGWEGGEKKISAAPNDPRKRKKRIFRDFPFFSCGHIPALAPQNRFPLEFSFIPRDESRKSARKSREFASRIRDCELHSRNF